MGPLRTPVAASKVTPDGSDPVRENVDVKFAVTVKVSSDDFVKTLLLSLVMSYTVRVTA